MCFEMNNNCDELMKFNKLLCISQLVDIQFGATFIVHKIKACKYFVQALHKELEGLCASDRIS